MEDTMKEIMILCVRYHEMYMMERAVRNCNNKENYKTLVNAYNLDKKIFDEQYEKVETLINSGQKTM